LAVFSFVPSAAHKLTAPSTCFPVRWGKGALGGWFERVEVRLMINTLAGRAIRGIAGPPQQLCSIISPYGTN